MEAYEIYQQIDPVLVTEMFSFFREEERELYKNTLTTLAQERKLRAVFVQRKPLPEQFSWMHKTLKLRTNTLVGEHLFQVWMMRGHWKMLTVFCDGVDISHDGKGVVEGELPATIEHEKLKTTVDSMMAEFNPKVVTLYLFVFNQQKDGGWPSIDKVLTSDKRLGLA